MRNIVRHVAVLVFATSFAYGCDDSDPDVVETGEENENEFITDVALTFESADGTSSFTWQDLDGEGGTAPMIQDITLAADTTYTMSLTITNAAAMPAEDVTEEVEDEPVEHQVFILGSDVSGPGTDVAADGALLTHAYADMESDYADDGGALPVGLANTITTSAAGMGAMTVVLRHMPPEGDTAVKTATAAADVAAGGLTAIGGSNDFDITFNVTVE